MLNVCHVRNLQLGFLPDGRGIYSTGGKKLKVKVTPVQALRLCTGRTAHRGSRGIALIFHDHGTRKEWGVSVMPQPLFTPRKTRYPLYRRLSGPQGRSGQVPQISPQPGFDPGTVQPVVSRYIDWAIAAHTYVYNVDNFPQVSVRKKKSCLQFALFCYITQSRVTIPSLPLSTSWHLKRDREVVPKRR